MDIIAVRGKRVDVVPPPFSFLVFLSITWCLARKDL